MEGGGRGEVGKWWLVWSGAGAWSRWRAVVKTCGRVCRSTLLSGAGAGGGWLGGGLGGAWRGLAFGRLCWLVRSRVAGVAGCVLRAGLGVTGLAEGRLGLACREIRTQLNYSAGGSLLLFGALRTGGAENCKCDGHVPRAAVRKRR